MLIYPAPQIFKGNCYKILTVDSDLQPKIVNDPDFNFKRGKQIEIMKNGGKEWKEGENR